MNKIAVILAAFNGEKWLPEQIQSILAQKNVDVRIFVSLDKSSDASKSMLEGMAGVDSRIIFLEEAERGSAGKNFYGLIKNQDIPRYFDYYCLADQDDIWLDEKLSRAVMRLKETGSRGYSSNVTAFWASGERRMIVKSQPQRKWDYFFEAAGPGCTYVLDAGLYRELTNFIRASEIPVERFEAHDWLIYAFARSRAYPWVIDERSYMLYRQHASNQVGANKGVKAYIKRLRTVMSGEWFAKVETLIEILDLNGQGPASLIAEKKPSSYLKMAFQAKNFRRKKSEQYLLSILFIVYAFNLKLKI